MNFISKKEAESLSETRLRGVIFHKTVIFIEISTRTLESGLVMWARWQSEVGVDRKMGCVSRWIGFGGNSVVSAKMGLGIN
jgi:hypothetical protein